MRFSFCLGCPFSPGFVARTDGAVLQGVHDWCDTGTKHEACPNDQVNTTARPLRLFSTGGVAHKERCTGQDQASQGRTANRRTLSWNHDATGKPNA